MILLKAPISLGRLLRELGLNKYEVRKTLLDHGVMTSAATWSGDVLLDFPTLEKMAEIFDFELLVCLELPVFDLRSQIGAVRSVVGHLCLDDQLEWLSKRGNLQRFGNYQDVYYFTSVYGVSCRVIADLSARELSIDSFSIFSRIARFHTEDPLAYPTKERLAAAVVDQLNMAIRLYAYHVQRFPTESEGFSVLIQAPEGLEKSWHGPYIPVSGVPLDPWGGQYIYSPSGVRTSGGQISASRQ